MNDSFFLSRQFAAYLLIASLVIVGCYAWNNRLENQCLAKGGAVISQPDNFSLCAFNKR